jgi:DNA-binding transcriptional ArsR family regulator
MNPMPNVLTAVSTPRRREILRLVWREELSAGDIHRALGDVTFGAVSQHLRVLESAGLVRARRDGRHRRYAARPAQLGALRGWLERMWDDALYQLKVRAELEQARRGPMPRTQQPHRGSPTKTPPPHRRPQERSRRS